MSAMITELLQQLKKIVSNRMFKKEAMKKPIRFLIENSSLSDGDLQATHAGNLGDIVFSCLFLKSFWQSTGKKIKLHLQTNVPTEYCVEHPLKNIHMDKRGAEQLVPLLLAQPYVSEVTYGECQLHQIELDLNLFRHLPINLCTGLIQGWQQLCTNIWLNVFDPWIEAKTLQEYEKTIVISRTARLRSDYISYQFLDEFAEQLLFIGLPQECERFKEETGIECAYLTVDNFHLLADILNSCHLFIGNQGFLYTLAESVKCPRVLESNSIAPNNYPMSSNGRIALFQDSFEHFVKSMIQGKKKS
ncbi:MAG: hypothetical protein ACH350_09605 [Parachlamydiaceae bacterium]